MKNLINLGIINNNSAEVNTFIQYAKRYGISIVKIGKPCRGKSTRYISPTNARKIVYIYFHNKTHGSYLQRYAGTTLEHTMYSLYTFLKENHPNV